MNRAATTALLPLSLLYGASIKTRSALYRRGLLRTQKVAAPVISVGNLTTGGTGKSPLVEWIARKLADRGRRVCILTRGYGRTNSHQRVVVSDGQHVETDVSLTGDEPLMLAEALRGKAAVICDRQRAAAAHWAIENLKSDVFILDDGFQHLGLARDLDIVTVDATKPFGNGWLLPAGNLREPVSSLARADCIVMTRTTENHQLEVFQRLSELTPAPILKSRTLVKGFRELNSHDLVGKDLIRDNPVAAFCGIGNPEAFFDQLRTEGFDLRHTATFRDHYVYAQSDIERLTQESIARGAKALLTTAKDAVKLRSLNFSLPCYVLAIEIEILEADHLLRMIDRAIHLGK